MMSSMAEVHWLSLVLCTWGGCLHVKLCLGRLFMGSMQLACAFLAGVFELEDLLL